MSKKKFAGNNIPIRLKIVGVMELPIRVGIPRGLLYYHYGLLWENFLRHLGAEVIVSGETSQATLNYGGVLDEVCLPVKAYFGHVYQMCGNVDCLFVPRVISVAKRQYTCPKIIGISDILRSNIAELPQLLDVNVNLYKHRYQLYQAVINIGKELGKRPLESVWAWYWACRQNKCRPGINGQLSADHPDQKAKRVGLIGHPYIIYDRQLSMNVLEKLRDMGTAVATADMVDDRRADAAAGVLDKRIFWSFCHHLAGAALALLEPPVAIDGLILITSFCCGPDSLVVEMIKKQAQHAGVPCMLLTMDEHMAEAGVVTRLEAFVDMLGRG